MSIARETSRLVGLDIVGKVAAGTVAEVIHMDGIKGCDPTVLPDVVDLEPPYRRLGHPSDGRDSGHAASPRLIECPVILKVWCPTDHGLEWLQYNDLHKELAVLSRPIAFEILGNSEGVWPQLVVDAIDLPPTRTAIEAEFPSIRLEELKSDVVESWVRRIDLAIEIEDFFPSSGEYFRTMTIHSDIGGSPLAPLYAALGAISKEDFAAYRVLSAATDPRHDWHANINTLTDMAYRGSNEDFYNPAIPHAYHQVPSLYLPMISEREERKAHPDRPFHAVSVMTVALARDAGRLPDTLRTMRTALANFFHGARPLSFQRKRPYVDVLGNEEALRDMLARRTVHRHGMILNSLESSGLIHFPPGPPEDQERDGVPRLKGRKVPESLRSGRLLIGYNHYMGAQTPVYIPERLFNEHIYSIGKSGVGKSIMQRALILQEIREGRGVGLVEPTGEETQAVLKRIPKARVKDVVYVDFQDPDYVPCFNPFDAGPHEDKGRLADEIASAFLAGVDSKGPRMENILRQACYALLHIPNAAFADIGLLLARTTDGDRLRSTIPKYLTNPDALGFWQRFAKYTQEALDPVLNKISKLMLNSRIAEAFSQRKGKIKWRAILDESKIFLVNLSGLGSRNTDFVGALIIGEIKEAVCSRADTPPEARRPFSLYVDEFHRFPTESLESLLVESRKYRLSLRLAHQETGQIDYATRRAVGTADTLIAFCVDAEDAGHLVKEFRNEIEGEDLLELRVGEVYARINNEIVDFTTVPPADEPDEDVVAEIIEQSRRNYYVKRSECPSGAPAALETPKPVRIFQTF